PGVADLTREETDRIDPGLVDDRRERRGRARIRTLQVRPVALGLEAEHPVARLPAIADLTTDETAGRIMATFRHGRDRSDADNGVEVPALVAGAAAAVEADIEATPVVDRGDHRGRLSVGPRGKVSRQRRSDAQTNKTGRSQQNFLHLFFPIFLIATATGIIARATSGALFITQFLRERRARGATPARQNCVQWNRKPGNKMAEYGRPFLQFIGRLAIST